MKSRTIGIVSTLVMVAGASPCGQAVAENRDQEQVQQICKRESPHSQGKAAGIARERTVSRTTETNCVHLDKREKKRVENTTNQDQETEILEKLLLESTRPEPIIITPHAPH